MQRWGNGWCATLRGRGLRIRYCVPGVPVAVTHSRPDAATDGVEMPAIVKRDLGLDREPSWIMVTEINQFRWPGPDVRLVDGDTPYHGAIPDWLFERVRGAFAGKVGRVRVTRRSE